MLLKDSSGFIVRGWKKRIKNFKLPIPFYVLVLVVLNLFAWALVGGLLLTRSSASTDLTDSDFIAQLKADVLPSEGYETALTWGDIGKKLVDAGAIDVRKYEELFKSPTEGRDELGILAGESSKKVSINENNSRFVLNTLWALGLTQKSKVLDEGPMKTAGYDPGNFASTAGWTLGSKDAMELYSSYEFVELNDFQQDLVEKIAERVYRPCCGNHTAFPDCNHGMAALGLIELEVAAGISEDQIYKDVLAFNSFWFPQTYFEIAAYFAQQGTSWDKVDPRVALSYEYSSAEGAQKVNAAVKNVPGLEQSGGGCGV